MMPWTTVCLCAGFLFLVLTVILAKKRRNGAATIAGFLAALLLAGSMYLSVVEKPLYYARHQNKDTYLAMQNDKNISSFRIVVDGKITNRFPEWDDENPFSYQIFYDAGEIRITTNN